MVRVTAEDEVDPAGGDKWVAVLAQHHLDVVVATVRNAPFEVLDHVGIDIDRVHQAVATDGLGKAEREVAAARADVGNPLTGLDPKHLDHALGLLPGVTEEALVGKALECRAPGRQHSGGQEGYVESSSHGFPPYALQRTELAPIP